MVIEIMGMLENLIITAVVEDTPGTLKADSSADAVKFTKDTKPPKTAVTFIENPEMTGTLSPSRGYIGPDDGGFDISLLLRGSGYQNVEPPMGKFLKACGFVANLGVGGVVASSPTPTTTAFSVEGADLAVNDIIMVNVASGSTPTYEIVKVTAVTDGTGEQTITVSPALSVAPTATKAVIGQYTYKPTSDRDAMESLSVYHYLDGIKIAQPGCRANVKFDFKWGEMGKAVFSFVPLSWTPTTAEAGFTPDFSDLLTALPAMGGSFKVGAAEEYVESVSLDMGIKIPALGAIQTTGYYENFVSGRQPKGTFDPFANDAAHLTAFKAGTLASLWLRLGSGNNIFVTHLASIQRESVDFSDREGINTYGIGFGAYGVEGNDEIIMAFCSPITHTP